MKKYLYAVFFLILSYQTFASHIVGGEIELIKLKNPPQGVTHELVLNLYFDAINGRPQAEDIAITLSFIRKRDLAKMGEAICPQVYREYIKYIDPSCEKGDLKTILMRYKANVNLTEAAFSDPQGYAIVWERCCRNAIITNIINPSMAGMVFYTEFPPVTVANSTPHLKDVISDYLCINQNFEVDFSADDADGDSLTYELITPWIGYSTSNNPNPISIGRRTYPEARWEEGISLQNVIQGDIPLTIDFHTGLLKVKPNRQGLYVISVMIKEYRDGSLIGQTKRDFQLKVVDCKINLPPQIMVRNQGAKAFLQEGEVINLKKGDKRCFDIMYLDPDINQKITVKATGVNFDTQKIKLPSISNVLVQNSDTLRNSFCLDDCILTKDNQAAEFIISVNDNGCPVPQVRSYRMRINFEDVKNDKPVVTTSLTDHPTVMFGDTLKFTVFGDDADKDTVSLAGTARNSTLASLGFTFAAQRGVGSVKSTLQFIPNCEAVRKKQVFLDFTARDYRCGVSNPVIYTVPVVVVGPPNAQPSISTSLSQQTVEVALEPSKKQEIKFDVYASDTDNELINLVALPSGFELKNSAMSFENKEGKGSLNSVFSWIPECRLLAGQEEKEFVVSFRTQDKACDTKQDTISVKFVLKNKVLAPDTFMPYNTFSPNNDGLNDYFNLGELPDDNCNRQFMGFEVFNRYGKSVYRTASRDFRWSGDQEPTGEYFYSLHFTDRVFKGIIHLVR